MTESELYQLIKNEWRGYIQKIEVSNLNYGIPDLHLVNKNKNDIFLEIKYIENQFRDRTLPLRKSKFYWFEEYQGRNAFLLFKVFRNFYLFDKKQVLKLKGKIIFADFKKACLLDTENLNFILRYLEDL